MDDSENFFEEQGFDKEEIEEAEKDREYFPIDEIDVHEEDEDENDDTEQHANNG